MENNISPQDSQIERPAPPNPTMQTVPKSKSSFMLLGVVVGLVILASSVGAYYLGTQNNSKTTKNKMVAITTATPIPSSTPIPEKSSKAVSKAPTGWITETSEDCNVEFAIPPKKAPYYIPDNPETSADTDDRDGHFWSYEAGKHSQTTGSPAFDYYINMFYRNPNAAGSGYIAGIVSVGCSENTNNYTTDSLVAQYENNFTDGTFSGIKISDKEQIKKWGKNITAIYVTGGLRDGNSPQYFFATKEHIYLVGITTMSTHQLTIDTTHKILENLRFLD